MVLNKLRAGAAVVLTAAAACSGQQSAPKQSPPPDAKRVDISKSGTVRGRVLLDGPVPQNAPIKMAADPVCARENPNGATLETYLMHDEGLENVFVYVKDGLGNYYFDVPNEAVTLDQKGCQYRPHVFGIRVGQPLVMTNSDPTVHNVHAVAQANREFNFGQGFQGMKQTRTFTTREVMVPFKCDVHGWMQAYAGVLDHPYFAVTADGGKFELKNVPAGTYTIEAWHERLGTQTQTVTLRDKDSKEIAFTFKSATN